MKKILANYETLLKITNQLSSLEGYKNIPDLIVKNLKQVLEVKGCSFFLLEEAPNELKLVASIGLSDSYISKGPVSSISAIDSKLEDGPIAIYDVSDDPRIKYPLEAKQEGIKSILSVPMILNKKVIGAIRLYSSDFWNVLLEEVNFVQAIAVISSLAIEMGKLREIMMNEYLNPEGVPAL